MIRKSSIFLLCLLYSHTTVTLTTPTPAVCGFFPQPAVLWHQLNLILSLCTCGQPQVTGSVPQACTTSVTYCKSKCHLRFWLISYSLKFPTIPSTSSINFLEQFIELRKTIYWLFPSFYKKTCIRIQMNIRIEEMQRAQYVGKESRGPVPSPGTPLSRKLSELHPYFGDFKGGFITKAQAIINSISSPHFYSGEWEVGLKIPSF